MGTISRQPDVGATKKDVKVLILFGAFAIGGLAIFWMSGVRPIAKVLAGRDWIERPCKIISAKVNSRGSRKVNSRESEKATTHRIDIVYEYEYDGKTYKCDRYDFMGGGNSLFYKGKLKVVREYKEAEKPTCFVNPENPSEAVLRKGFHAEFLLGFSPLLFAFIGIGGLIKLFMFKGDSGQAEMLSGRAESSGEVVLESKSPWSKLLTIIVIAAFWNGVISLFVFDIIKKWQNGYWSIFEPLFLIPFVLIGILFIVFVFCALLELFNPRVKVTLSKGVICFGDIVRLQWGFKGKVGRIRKLEILLKASEITSCGEGRNRRTRKDTFFKTEIYSTQDSGGIVYGEVGFGIPGDIKCPSGAGNDKIIWEINVRGDIGFWPDVNENFKLEVVGG